MQLAFHHGLLAGVALVGALGTIASSQTESGDWPQWRGPNRDGSILSFRAPGAWPDRLTEKWKVDVGLGYATPILAGNRPSGGARFEVSLPVSDA